MILWSRRRQPSSSPTAHVYLIFCVDWITDILAQEVTRGMREAASRGFFLGSKAPFGYKRVKVPDGAKERPTLRPDPATAPIVKEVFESSLMGNGLKEICKELNDRGITNKGWRWHKTGLYYLLTNEAYTGTSVWGRTTRGDKEPEPVRVEGAWEALVSKALFDNVQQGLKKRAPKVQRPARVGSKFLLSGLLRCGTCGKPYIGQGAKSGQYGYYVCGTLHRQGAGTCQAGYLNAPKVEGFVIDKIRSNILTEGNIRNLVKVVAEEMDGVTREQRKRLETIEDELEEVKRKLGRIWHFIETSDAVMTDASDRIREHRERQERLEYFAEQARAVLAQRRKVLDDANTIAAYAKDMKDFLKESELTERRAFIQSFIKEIVVVPSDALLRYTVPMPDDSLIPGRTAEKVPLNGSVLSTLPDGGSNLTVRSTTFELVVAL